MTSLTRRQVLVAGAALPACAALPMAAAGGPEPAPVQRTLVVVQLRGGNDGLNTIVPHTDDRYYRARPDLAIPAGRILPLDDHHGFHPALARTARRYAEGQVAVIQGVGYPAPNLSHFRSQDIWDAADDRHPLPATGWMGRDCDRLAGPLSPLNMIALGRDVLPHAMRAEHALACAVPSLERYRIQAAPQGSGDAEVDARRRAIEALNPPDTGGALQPLAAAAAAARASIDALAQVAADEAQVEYPRSKLAAELALTARMIASGMPVRHVYVTQDGYDTHAAQAGAHRGLLATVDGAIDAFLRDLAAEGLEDRALVMTVSEFGRRLKQNGVGAEASGTDHGAASMQLLYGPMVRAGRIGAALDLDDLDNDGNPRHRIDFRCVYAGILEDWLGGDARHSVGEYEKLEVIA